MEQIDQLKQDVDNAMQAMILAEQNLLEAREKFQQAMRNRNLNLFDRWQAWSTKLVYEDIANVEAYYQPPASWINLKQHIMNKKGIDIYKGGGFNWTQEIESYISNRVFVNIPLELDDMIEALECVMDYDVNYHYESALDDM